MVTFQLFNLGKEKPVPVTGLEFDRLPSDSMLEYRYFILATTPARIYQFIGSVSKSVEPPMFQQLFQHYESGTGNSISMQTKHLLRKGGGLAQ